MSKDRTRNRLMRRSAWWDTFALGWFGALALAAFFDAIEGREPWWYVPLWGTFTVLVLVIFYIASRKLRVAEEEAITSGSRLITVDEAEIIDKFVKADRTAPLPERDKTWGEE